jgi:hypothetical protein
VSIAGQTIDVEPVSAGGKVYITGDDGTATIGTINGGYVGQEVLLVTYYSGTVTPTDGPSLDLGAGNYSLTQGKGIRLICNAAAGNGWVKVNF